MSFEFSKLPVDEMTARMCALIRLSRVYDPANTMAAIMNNLALEAEDASSAEELRSLIRSSQTATNEYLRQMMVAVAKFQKQLKLQEGTE